MSQPSVLVISDNDDFAPTIMARWQSERSVPAFLLMGTPVWSEALITACDLALFSATATESFAPILHALEAGSRPTIGLAADSGQMRLLRSKFPRLMLLRRHENWMDALVLLAGETLRRLEAGARARRAEQALARAETQATLGRYMAEMRHSFNNALTSVLGNSELLLLEPGTFSASVRDQLTTIHSMALRMHDILQRFNSMEREMKFTAPSQAEITAATATVAVTS